MKKVINYLALSMMLLLFPLVLFPPPSQADYLDPFTYQNQVNFNPAWLYTGAAIWSHQIPETFHPVSATISLELWISRYSQQGVLDIFSSNTNEMDYGNIYAAPSKPGFIADLWGTPLYQWVTINAILKPTQLDWLGDDGKIFLALEGPGYFLTDFDAQFYLKSATLTASAVPVPGAFWLVISGLVGLLGLKGFSRAD